METMSFPETVAQFLEMYSFTDKAEIYTNGVKLIPVFRVVQMLEHYFQNEKIEE
jgi:hypothetical protein